MTTRCLHLTAVKVQSNECTIQVKAVKQYFPKVLFILPTVQGGSNFQSVDDILV